MSTQIMNESQICTSQFNVTTYTTPFCEAVFDGALCWSPTIAGGIASQHCPPVKGFVPGKLAWRKCNDDGTWFNNNKGDLNSTGFTNFTECMNPLMTKLYNMCSNIGQDVCTNVVNTTRIIEMIGLSLSLVTLITSLIIFHRYRILRNNRTTIHKNLFIANLMQVILRLIMYGDQISAQDYIGNLPYLCEACHVLLEFSKISTIMWMFIEGLYLHNAITVTVFQEHSYIKVYCYVGWILPTILILIWVITMINTNSDTCWYLYNFLPNYWILEGPSSALLVVNLLFLLNIIRILIMKLRESNIGEIEQIRRAVRAAIFLVPLMGTSNILFMIDVMLFQNYWMFALWSYTTYFLVSFQGFFIATLYCFLNGEVKEAIKKTVAISIYMSQPHKKSLGKRSDQKQCLDLHVSQTRPHSSQKLIGGHRIICDRDISMTENSCVTYNVD